MSVIQIPTVLDSDLSDIQIVLIFECLVFRSTMYSDESGFRVSGIRIPTLLRYAACMQASWQFYKHTLLNSLVIAHIFGNYDNTETRVNWRGER